MRVVTQWKCHLFGRNENVTGAPRNYFLLLRLFARPRARELELLMRPRLVRLVVDDRLAHLRRRRPRAEAHATPAVENLQGTVRLLPDVHDLQPRPAALQLQRLTLPLHVPVIGDAAFFLDAQYLAQFGYHRPMPVGRVHRLNAELIAQFSEESRLLQ